VASLQTLLSAVPAVACHLRDHGWQTKSFLIRRLQVLQNPKNGILEMRIKLSEITVFMAVQKKKKGGICCF